MDPHRFSAIGHAGISYWNPVSERAIHSIIAELPLTPASKVLDVGCGRAELLLRILEKYSSAGVGVDTSKLAIDAACLEAECRLPHAELDLKCEAFDAAPLSPQSFDLVICIGSTHAISNLEQSMIVLSKLLKPGGLLLIGDGYWQKEPTQDYLDFLQCSADELRSHEGNVALASQQSLAVLQSHQTTAAEWSAYEDTYTANILDFIGRHPDDPDAAAMEERIRPWRDAYLKWGKDTLGFALYLLQKPA